MNTTAVGRAAEDLAASWLAARGLRLIEKNARTRFFELDLVMEQHKQIIFVEVKYRANEAFGGGVSTISADKRRRLLAGAQAWLLERGWYEQPIRFDVVVVSGDERRRQIQHLIDCIVLDE